LADVRLVGVCKSFGDVHVLRDIDLEIRDGEFMVFVGPSGCGKSTLLRTIAGLEDITGGELSIGGRVVNDVPPADRGIAMVFQSYALYPHMNLYDNMAFGLQLAKVPAAEIEAAVRQAARILHIEHLLERKPKDLSGGQRQRVAIGRAIVRKPAVFLFDEPLSNLDAALRVKMRVEFARLHEQLRTTMVYVTHDQVEAMTLADRIVVLSAGRIEQVGTPLELYEHPCNLFVAGFIGSPKMNFLSGRLVSGDASHALVELEGGQRLRCAVDASAGQAGEPLTVGVRPEHLALARAGTAPPPDGAPGGFTGPQALQALQARVTFVEALGGTTHAYCSHPASEEDLCCELDGRLRVRSGEVLTLVVPPDACYVFGAGGQAWRRHAGAERADAA
jgi:multiple sugar transport system ATP-binding protein